MPQFLGFSFPFRKGPTSFPQGSTDNDLIKEDLTQLVLTGSGERIFRPSVGAGAYSYVFEQNDELLQLRAESELTTLIGRFEPRVAVLSIQAIRGDQRLENTASTVTIVIKYVVLSTQSVQSTEIELS